MRSHEFCGCNVTLPHKESVAQFLDNVLPEARDAGSINTIYWENGQLCGTSTDGAGFVANVEERASYFKWSGSNVLVLGAGGSARAIIAGMLKRGVDLVYLWNRSAARAEALHEAFGDRVRPVSNAELLNASRRSDLVINTTSAGVGNTDTLEFDFHTVKPEAVVADIVYVPLITPFLSAAKARGHIIVPGLGMLLHQAVDGFEKWFGVRPAVTDELYSLVARDIEGNQKR